MTRRLLCLLVVCSLALSAESWAQDEVPLILDRKSEVKVRTGTKKKDDKNNGLQPAVPTVAPEDVIIAIVDSRVMTKADVQLRISARYQELLDKVRSQKGGVVAKFGPGMEEQRSLMSEQELLQEQEEELEKAMRESEVETLQEWVDFSILAEEARRQGIVVSDSQFRARLEQLKQENGLDDEYVNKVLKGMSITNEEFEKSVYDALMIESLLKKFIAMNFSEPFLRERYEANKAVFYQPRKFRVAHFSAALDEDGMFSKKTQEQVKKVAEEVKDKLKKGADPKKLFEQEDYRQMRKGYFGDTTSWYTFGENILPPIVEYKGRDMKVGETSDVLTNSTKEEGKIVPLSYHVIKIMEMEEESGLTYETALPAIERGLLELAQTMLLKKLRESNMHKVVTNLGGIKPEKIPSRADLMKFEAQAQPISLKLPES